MLKTQFVHDRILIIDFGSQVTQLIARRVRESGVFCEIHPFNKVDPESLKAFEPSGIILSGGPASVHGIAPPMAHADVFKLGVPILGICYGEQTIVKQMGGDVEPSAHRELRLFGHHGSSRPDIVFRDPKVPQSVGFFSLYQQMRGQILFDQMVQHLLPSALR